MRKSTEGRLVTKFLIWNSVLCVSHIKSKPNFVFINSTLFNQNINYSMVDYTIRF